MTHGRSQPTSQFPGAVSEADCPGGQGKTRTWNQTVEDFQATMEEIMNPNDWNEIGLALARAAFLFCVWQLSWTLLRQGFAQATVQRYRRRRGTVATRARRVVQRESTRGRP